MSRILCQYNHRVCEGILTSLRSLHLRTTNTKFDSLYCCSAIVPSNLYSYLLTPWSRVLLEKLTGFQLVKKFLAFHYRIHKRLPSVPILSQLYPVHTPTSHFLNIHLNISFTSTPGSSKWSLSFRFSNQNPVYAFPLSNTCYMLRPSHYLQISTLYIYSQL